MIFGSDGVEMIERAREESKDRKTMTVSISSLLALIDYYKRLTVLCAHEWDVTSPVDSAELCVKCGLIRKI